MPYERDLKDGLRYGGVLIERRYPGAKPQYAVIPAITHRTARRIELGPRADTWKDPV